MRKGTVHVQAAPAIQLGNGVPDPSSLRISPAAASRNGVAAIGS
ncbi:MAG: hypothetical protein KatS3mg119_1403 [Rhodothalassiaceae bacterium]|nr:MAG: hypothetical protein KatS3mg119_1403 [Rhodothalassiaceae bacterium]